MLKREKIPIVQFALFHARVSRWISLKAARCVRSQRQPHIRAGSRARHEQLERTLLKRKREQEALAVVREARARVEINPRTQKLLGAAVLCAGAEGGDRIERHWMREVEAVHLPASRQVGTLDGHASEWVPAWAWMQARLEGRGLDATLQQLVNHPTIVTAWLAKRLQQSQGPTAVTRAATAINYVLGLHDLPPLANLTLAKAVKSAARKTRRRPRKQAAIMEVSECADIVNKWGFKSEEPWKRWVALLIGLEVGTVARWADLNVPICGIILPRSGAGEMCMPRRKNRQEGQVFWAALPPSMTVQLLRELVASLGYSFDPVTGAAAAPADAFLFPRLQHVPGSGRKRGAQWKVVPSRAPLDKTQYGVYLRLFRRALKECCALTPRLAALFSLHSGRRTGNTLNRRAGKSQEERMAAGCWLNQDSERLYNDYTLEERAELFSATAI